MHKNKKGGTFGIVIPMKNTIGRSNKHGDIVGDLVDFSGKIFKILAYGSESEISAYLPYLPKTKLAQITERRVEN